MRTSLPTLVSAALFSGVLALAVANPGCTSTCTTRATEDNTREVTSGQTSTDRTFYKTSDFSGPFLAFPPGRTYQFIHGLDKAPDVVNVYVSFDEEAVPETSVSQSPGNQALIEVVDEEMVQIRNDTCADFYVMLTAQTFELEDSVASN